jgi:LacI family transcriptional regulator
VNHTEGSAGDLTRPAFDGPARLNGRVAASTTVHDVARAAGVTIGTVSKALNGRGKLRAETRQRVREAAARLGYRPNHLAHSLRRGRTFTVGLLTTDRYGRFSIPLLAGVEDALGDARISVFLCNARDDPERERQHLDSLLAKRVDGIIVTGRRIDRRPPIDLGGARVPVLYAFAQSTDPGALCLIPDDAGGGRLAAEHLVSVGRQRLAHVTGPDDFEAVRRRRDGMLAALAERGLDCPERRILSGPWSEAWGYHAAHRLLERDPSVDAIFCGSDLLARGVVDALRERGVRVPDDIAVVGFDNWEIIASATRPPLTTVDLELESLGRLAGRRLLDLIDGHAESGLLQHPCRMVVRTSCGASARSLGADAAPVLGEVRS